MAITLGNAKIAHTGKHISVIEQSYTNDKKVGTYEVIVRNNVSSIISVLPITQDNEIVLIRQFRIPLGQEVIEQPAGLNDKPGESNINAAKRELLEETGYSSDELEYILTVPTSSGLTNELISCYVARNCQKVSHLLDLDSSESISVLTLPIETAFQYLVEEARKGNLVDSKVFMMLQWYLSAMEQE